MRVLAIGAFVLDGVAVVAYVAVITLGDRQVSPMNALVMAALLAGFFCALGAVLRPDDDVAKDEEIATLLIAGAAMFDDLTEDAKDDVRRHFPHRHESPVARAPAEPDVVAAIDLGLAPPEPGVSDLALGVH
jgi:hypothetical protein